MPKPRRRAGKQVFIKKLFQRAALTYELQKPVENTDCEKDRTKKKIEPIDFEALIVEAYNKYYPQSNKLSGEPTI